MAAKRNHIGALDGLRGLAALWVLAGHSAMLTAFDLPVISHPRLGVDLFMLLSGFLMAFHYNLRRAREPWEAPTTWATFWVRRFFRIAPLYYLLLFVALLVGPQIGHWREVIAEVTPSAATDAVRFTDRGPVNILAHVSFLFGFLPDYGFRTPLPDWSIGLEMAFYMAFPALMLAFDRLGSVLAAVLISVLCGVLWFVIPSFLGGFGEPSFLTLKLPVFLAGMLVAMAMEMPVGRAIMAVVVGLVLVIIPWAGPDSIQALIVRAGLFAVIVACVHLQAVPKVGGLAKLGSDLLSTRPMVLLGNASYGVYLLHLLVMTPAMAWLSLHVASRGIRFAACLVITAAVCYPIALVLFYFWEKPGIALGKRLLEARRTSV